jgi:hypothetical protein
MSWRAFDRLAAMNAATQTALAGVYAWGVTVAPAALSRGAPPVAKVAMTLALAALGANFAAQRYGERARRVGLWGFVLSCAGVWSAVPGALSVLRVDVVRGIAGMLGWALFALVSAAPARPAIDVPLAALRSFPPRQELAPGDRLYVATGALVAAALQLVGWRVVSPERALLVRCVVVASGLALIGASVELALARHVRPNKKLSALAVLRPALPFAVLLAVLVAAGCVSSMRRW